MNNLRHDHIWFEVLTEHFTAGRPALFIDRDGVVVEETNYLHRIEDVCLIAGIAQVVSLANRLNCPVIIVTNQAGIGRGYYGWAEFEQVNRYIVEILRQNGAQIDAVLACPFHEQGVGLLSHPDHPMRKPNPGMFLLAGDFYKINYAASLVIGDQISDLRAGQQAGLLNAIHVLTGHGVSRREEAQQIAEADFTVTLADSVADPVVAEKIQQMAAMAGLDFVVGADSANSVVDGRIEPDVALKE